MSQENVEAIQRVITAINAGDVDAAVREIHERAEYVDHRPSHMETFRGHDAFRPHLEAACKAAEDAPIKLTVIASEGEHVVARQTAGGVDRWVVRTFREGLVSRVQVFGSAAEALEAVGLRERRCRRRTWR